MADSSDFDLDAAISADLDGELDHYATAIGRDPGEVRAQLADPAAARRRGDFDALRAAIQEPVIAPDELSRARLLAGAVAASGTQAAATPPSRAYIRLASAAAIVVAVVGLGVVLVNRGGGDSAKSSSTAGSSGPIRSGNVGDLGELDQRKLDKLIGGPVAGAPSTHDSTARSSAAGAAGAADAAFGATSSVPRAAEDTRVPGLDPASGARATKMQVGACTDAYASQGRIRFTGSGAFHGQPAVVLGIANGDRTIVFVVEASNCTNVLFSLSR